MELIKKYKFVIAIVLPVMILVLIRSFGSSHFKSDAKKWSESSVTQSNLITEKEIGTLHGEVLLIDLGRERTEINMLSKNKLYIRPDSILSKEYINTIKNHEGPILLYSTEPSISARIWMVLSQLGYKNIFILTNSADNEVLKYKFLPDTTNGRHLKN